MLALMSAFLAGFFVNESINDLVNDRKKLALLWAILAIINATSAVINVVTQ